MAIDDKIRDEKLQNDINREDAKISALSSGKSDSFEYLTGKEILHPSQSRVIEQAKFTYSPLGKALEKKKKQVGALKSLNLSNETNELKKIEIIFPKTS